MAIVPFSVILLTCLLPSFASKIVLERYQLDVTPYESQLNIHATITFTPKNLMTEIHLARGDYTNLIASDITNEPYTLEIKSESPGKNFLHCIRPLQANVSYKFELTANVDMDTSKNLIRGTFPEPDSYYFLTSFEEFNKQRVFPTFRNFTLDPAEVVFTAHVPHVQTKDLSAFFTNNIAGRKSEDGLHLKFVFNGTFPLNRLHFLISSQALVRGWVASITNYNYTRIYKVYCREKLNIQSVKDRFSELLYTIKRAFIAFEKLIDRKHPLDHITIIVLPMLSERVLDGPGIMYFSEEMFTTYAQNHSHELKHLAADKVVNQFMGFHRVNDDIVRLRAALLNIIKYDQLMGPGEPILINTPVQRLRKRLHELYVGGLYNPHKPELWIEQTESMEEKAGSVFRMMAATDNGIKLMRKAIQSYFSESYLSSTKSPDFLLTDERKKIWESFKTGYPVLRISACPNLQHIFVGQIRFSYYGIASQDSNYSVRFNMTSLDTKTMVSYSTDDFDNEPYTIQGDWPVVLNTNWVGFYRVKYPEDFWDQIVEHMSFFRRDETLSHFARAQFFDDAFNLARMGDFGYAEAFAMAETIGEDNAPVIWEAFYINMRYLRSLGQDTDGFDDAFAGYIATKIEPVLGNPVSHAIRNYAIKLACLAEIEPCVTPKNGFYKTDNQLLNPDDDPLVGCTANRKQLNLERIHSVLVNRSDIDFDTRLYYIQNFHCAQNDGIKSLDLVTPIFHKNSSLYTDYEKYKAADAIIEFGSRKVIENLITLMNNAILKDENLHHNVIKKTLYDMVYRVSYKNSFKNFKYLAVNANSRNVIATNDSEKLEAELYRSKQWTASYGEIVTQLLRNYLRLDVTD